MANNTDCGGGSVCCNGACQADCTCTGLPCSNGDCCTNNTDFACCEDGCCPQVSIPGRDTSAYCAASGSNTTLGFPTGGCCQPDKLIKGSAVDSTSGQCACGEDVAFAVWCEGNLPPSGGIYGTPCSCGYWFA